MVPRLIVSLFDFTGNWCRPYREAGYDVEQVDIKLGQDVLIYEPSRRPWGVLAAPPCTIWTNAAAWQWGGVPPEEFDLNRRLILAAVRICRSAEKFWALENPRGRLARIFKKELGPHVWEFQPSDYGDAHTKRTCLWGDFNLPQVRRVLALGSLVSGQSCRKDYPLFGVSTVSKGWDLFPKKFSKMTPAEKEERRVYRSTTPPGFARQFFCANP